MSEGKMPSPPSLRQAVGATGEAARHASKAIAPAPANTPKDVFKPAGKGEQKMRNVIRLGDTTSHGGKVVSTRAGNFKVGGISVACVGDSCSCPIPGHNGCTIASGSARHRIGGLSIAFEDDVTSCGAKLKASLRNFRTD